MKAIVFTSSVIAYRAFCATGPRRCNSLLPVIRLADSVDTLKAQLKT